MLASNGEVFGVPIRDGGSTSLAATYAQDLVFSNLLMYLLMLVNYCFWDYVILESELSRRLMVLVSPVADCCWCVISMILLRAFLTALTYLLVMLSCLSSCITLSISWMMRFEGEIPSFGLGVDMALIIHNLGTKLMRWMSSIDCDYARVSSLTVYQCSDEREVFTIG